MSDETPVPTEAICPAPSTEQPRQPSSLQGLLKFAMEAAKTEDAPGVPTLDPLDEEKRVFLENALRSLTVDVPAELKKQITILQNVGEVTSDDCDITEFMDAFEKIIDYVCDLDMANDFHKIGGLSIMEPCLRSKNRHIRVQVCNLIAELSQNNLYWQKILAESEILPLIFERLEDADTGVIIKALYAISCIVRQNPTGYQAFITHGGLDLYLRALSLSHNRIITKICFFLNRLCKTEDELASRLVFHGYIPTLLKIISASHNAPQPYDEYVLDLLLTLVTNNQAAVTECKQQQLHTKQILEDYMSEIKHQSHSTEEELVISLWNVLFKD